MKDINKQIKSLEEEFKIIDSKFKNETLELKKLQDEFDCNEQVMKFKSNLKNLVEAKDKVYNQIKLLKLSNIKAGNYYSYKQDFIYLLNFNDVYFYYINKDSDELRIDNDYINYYFDDLLELTSCFTETQEFKDFKNDVENFLNEIKKVI